MSNMHCLLRNRMPMLGFFIMAAALTLASCGAAPSGPPSGSPAAGTAEAADQQARTVRRRVTDARSDPFLAARARRLGAGDGEDG